MQRIQSDRFILHPSAFIRPTRLVACKQLNNEKLTQAIALAETLLAGATEILARWNRESLRWRGKLKPN